MNRADPFTGYSMLLRIIIYGLVPAFGVFQYFRLRRAFHIFQLESYKAHWYLDWLKADWRRALFLKPAKDAKKPLVMTGRAWRAAITGVVLSVFGVLLPSGAAHLLAGAPFDLIVCALMFGLLFFYVGRLALLSDRLMSPVQKAINQRFLRSARAKLKAVAPTVVGVTGSFGKTSTKFAIQQLLGAPDEVLATPGSFNTPLGVSRTINESLQPGHRFFVVEMGARQEGDIAEICSLVHPVISVLTAIGPAHLESFGSLDAIRRGKYEIVESLPDTGIAVMNVDDPEVRALASRTTRVEVIRYGIEDEGAPDIQARDLRLLEDGTACTIADNRSGHGIAVHLGLLGRHAIGHALAAVAVASAAGRALEDLVPALEEMKPVEHRLQVIKGAGGVTVIDDAYNSNPAGASAALDVLDKMPARRKVVITPGMVELGPLADEANAELGSHCGRVADVAIFVASLNRDALVRGAAGSRAQVITVDSLAQATERLKGLVGPGDVVLFENDLPDHLEG